MSSRACRAPRAVAALLTWTLLSANATAQEPPPAPGPTTPALPHGPEQLRRSLFGTISYLLPWTIGIGRLQPSFRHHATFEAERSTQDAFLTYVVNKYFARFHLGFQRTDYGGGVLGNAVQMGAQVQKM